jgi:hypothetical protein
MSTRDINLFSFTGAYFSCQDYHSTDPLGGLVQPPTHQDTLKFSGLVSFRGHFGTVYGGTEDCADINNRCDNVRLHAAEWRPQGQYAFTVKGGCRNITLAGDLFGHGKTVDVDLGNWSDQSNEPTTAVTIDLYSQDDRPVIIRVLNADKPMVIGGAHRYAFPHPDAWYHGIVVKAWLAVWWLGKKLRLL